MTSCRNCLLCPSTTLAQMITALSANTTLAIAATYKDQPSALLTVHQLLALALVKSGGVANQYNFTQEWAQRCWVHALPLVPVSLALDYFHGLHFVMLVRERSEYRCTHIGTCIAFLDCILYMIFIWRSVTRGWKFLTRDTCWQLCNVMDNLNA